jgi:hypothetical protein
MKKWTAALLLIVFLSPLFEAVVHANTGKGDCNLKIPDCHKKVCPLNTDTDKKHKGHDCELFLRCGNHHNKEMLKANSYENFYIANNSFTLSAFYPFLNNLSASQVIADKFNIPPPEIPPKTI